ncbi:hypothetical protein CCP1ISM_40029 [Azospirillaceae bacterium]
MIEDNEWYFDNITEGIVYGDIKSGGRWIEFKRRLKRNALIRKLGDDRDLQSNSLPAVLGKAIDEYRTEHKIEWR